MTTPADVTPRLEAAAAHEVNVGELLGLGSRPARIVLAIFMASTVMFTLATLDTLQSVWPSLAALVIVNAAALLLVTPRPDPFPMKATLLVLAAVLISTALVSWQLPTEGSPGRASWHLGANTWLLFVLILRRRAKWGWLGYAGMCAITVAWAESTGRGWGAAVNLLNAHAGILLVATLFGANLRRTAFLINRLNKRALEDASASVAAMARREIRLQRVTELSAIAVPLLEDITTDADPGPDERRDYRLAEATLRDSVRGRSLALPAITDATRRARMLGVEVTLLDDRGGPLPLGEAMQRINDAVVRALDTAREGKVTVRLLPAGRDVALSIVSDDGTASSRLDLTDQGVAVGLVS